MPLQYLNYQMCIKDHKYNVCFCSAVIGVVSPQGAPPYNNFPIIKYTFWFSPQHKHSILYSGLG